ncbi:peptidase domain-containing ABC transporter [Amphritea japonica]|uniref:ATP-binding cassette, subfamily C, bacterial n=1 Tax=Amphritea japonica ATCC BAA-1530 TaxID=1278309 RepID=A0A7R6P0Z2_9GAMM|nr:peptidase domain-containing ABC transporter [Amphritea japonica]BBB25128.1 ATP-binding cassette, subfamily C, bacterial [Amphritea japonica ATCC BAA-1530]
MSSNPRPMMASEQLADDLRNHNETAFKKVSPFSSCLLPLLRELGWNNYAKELIEALPHFSEQIDLIDVRNMLATLGYESTPVKTSVSDLKKELYPALFISDNNRVLLLQGLEDETVFFYDPESDSYETSTALDLQGTAYLFTDNHAHHGSNTPELTNDWFGSLLQRFNKMIIHLLGMTFIINLAALLVPLFIMVIYDKVIGAKSAETLPFLITGAAILLAADLGLRYLRAKLLGVTAGRLDYLIGVETFKRMLYLPPLYTERSTVAAQLSRLKQFDSVRDFFTGPSAAIALELPFVILFLIVIGILGGVIALIPLAMVIGFIMLGLFWMPMLNSKIMRAGKARTDKQRIIMQTVAGRKEIKSIGGETVWWERFRENSGESVLSNYQTFLSNNVMNNLAQGMMTFTGVAVLGVGTMQVMAGDMTIGALIAIMALVWRVLSPLQSAFLSFSKFQQTIKAIRQINQLMKLRNECSNGKSGLILEKLKGDIRIERVSFRYGPDRDPALLGVSFQIKPGEMVAISGNTGSGKSTLMKMIAGMYAPQAGSLQLDGMDLRQLNAMDLRRAIAYVPQQIHMFHGTIAQNIRLNNSLATDKQVRDAAAEAGVLDEIMALPEGLDTRIGDTTIDRMPPGFLRSLSMARAFVSPAKILLLDEPGASLDDESDKRFVEQLNKIKGSRSIIMVSHRPSHIRLADKAILMEQGAVIHAGSPDEVVSLLLENAA